MAYWQRVTVQSRTVALSATGAEQLTWADLLADIEARVAPLVHDETLQSWATPEEQAYQVQLRGAQSSVEPRMRITIDGDAFDIREVIQPPPFGTPTTVCNTVKVLP